MTLPVDSGSFRTPTEGHERARCELPRYPNGWYAVALSSEIRRGEAKPLRYLGRDFVAFRGETGRVRVLDAYCPHYGAHLGHGGKVEGDSVACPFHGWRFDGTGRCVHAPFAERPPRVGVRAHVVREQDGVVLLFHHARGDAPTYEPMRMPELFGPTHRTPVEIRARMRCHIQEVRENIVDESHFAFLHDQPRPPAVELEPNGPFAVGRLRFRYLGVELRVEASMCGPGIMAVRTIGLFDTCNVAFTTPIDDETSEMRWFGCTRKSRVPFFARTVEALAVRKARREVAVEVELWDHKTHIERPIYLPHERGIAELRRWYAQFYEGHSNGSATP